jgi:putative transposase
MQDENINGWKKFNFGKQIQHSILGRVKAKLINHPRVKVIDRFAPTSKFCPVCHNKKNDLKLSDRIYKCGICGYEKDRDIHAANNMIIMIKMIDAEKASLVPVGRREFKPVEIINSSSIKELTTAEAGRSHPSGCD